MCMGKKKVRESFFGKGAFKQGFEAWVGVQQAQQDQGLTRQRVEHLQRSRDGKESSAVNSSWGWSGRKVVESGFLW